MQKRVRRDDFFPVYSECVGFFNSHVIVVDGFLLIGTVFSMWLLT